MLPYEKFSIRLIDLIGQAIGGLAAPHQIKRIARAEAEAARHSQLLDAQTKKDLLLIQQGKAKLRNGVIESAPEVFQDIIGENGEDKAAKLISIANSSSDADAARRVLNILSIAQKAKDDAEQVSTNEEISEQHVDPDWFVKWRLGAQEVSNDEIQQIWARILAGEIKQPGTYDLRTLQFMSQMSRKDAEFIQHMAQFRTRNAIYKPENIEDNPFFKFSDILRLNELGLVVSGVDGLGLSTTFTTSSPDKFVTVIVGNVLALLIEHPEKNKKLVLPTYVVSNVFQQLADLSRVSIDRVYMEHIGHQIKKQGFSVRCGNPQVQNSRVFFTNLNEL